jgi:hypothetical protein
MCSYHLHCFARRALACQPELRSSEGWWAL